MVARVNTSRREELATALRHARERVAGLTGGDPNREVTIVAVTKRFPATDVRELRDLGVTDVAENRQQEALAKHADYLRLGGDPDLRWHFIGQLQSNKARSVAAVLDSVDTVDRPSVVAPLARGAQSSGRRVDCLVQVSLAGESAGQEHRGGCAPSHALSLARTIEGHPHLRLAGVMGMAPLGGDPLAAYTLLAEVSAQIRSEFPEATAISAGMSGDLDAALACGATQVRLGTAILGPRPSLG